MSVNKVLLIGNLGADPEIRSFSNGGRVARLRVATTEKWKDKQTGERQERTEWHSVAVFADHTIGFLETYARKGDRVYIEGKLETRKWQDQEGKDRYSTEVVVRPFTGDVQLLGSPGGANGRAAARQDNDAAPTGGSGRPASGSEMDLADEIPF